MCVHTRLLLVHSRADASATRRAGTTAVSRAAAVRPPSGVSERRASWTPPSPRGHEGPAMPAGREQAVCGGGRAGLHRPSLLRQRSRNKPVLAALFFSPRLEETSKNHGWTEGSVGGERGEQSKGCPVWRGWERKKKRVGRVGPFVGSALVEPPRSWSVLVLRCSKTPRSSPQLSPRASSTRALRTVPVRLGAGSAHRAGRNRVLHSSTPRRETCGVALTALARSDRALPSLGTDWGLRPTKRIRAGAPETSRPLQHVAPRGECIHFGQCPICARSALFSRGVCRVLAI